MERKKSVSKRNKKKPPHLLELERAGLARIGRGKLPEDFWKTPRPSDPEDLALRALLEERGEKCRLAPE